MLRLPNVHPSDTTKWPGGTGRFDIGAYDEGSKILMYNETPLNIDVDFLNGYTDVLHAWEARWWKLDGASTYLSWTIDADSLSVTTPPIDAVFLTLYAPSEAVIGAYPMPLVRTVGGNVTTQQSQTLDNTGNAPNSNVVTIGSTAANGNTVTLTNDGLLQLAVTIAGALKTVLQTFEPGAGGTVLQLGIATYLAEILGNLKVDGTSSFDNGLIITDGSGHLILANNTTLRAKDTGGTAQPLMYLAADNNVYFACGPSQHYTIQGFNFTNNVAVFHGDTQAIELSTAGALTHILGSLTSDQLATLTGGVKTNTISDGTNGNAALDLSAGTGDVTFDKNITVDGTTSVGGQIISPTGKPITLNSASGQQIQLLQNGTTIGYVDATGIHLFGAFNFDTGSTGKFKYNNATTMQALSNFNGTGSGTYNHNLGTTPFFIIPIVNVAGSATQGYDTVTSTQVHVTLGASLSFRAWASS